MSSVWWQFAQRYLMISVWWPNPLIGIFNYEMTSVWWTKPSSYIDLRAQHFIPTYIFIDICRDHLISWCRTSLVLVRTSREQYTSWFILQLRSVLVLSQTFARTVNMLQSESDDVVRLSDHVIRSAPKHSFSCSEIVQATARVLLNMPWACFIVTDRLQRFQNYASSHASAVNKRITEL